MKVILFYISLFISALWAYAENDEAQSSSFSVYKVAVIDINAIRKDSLLLRSMYEEANELSENLRDIIEKLQEDSQSKWEELNNASRLSAEEREKAFEKHQLLTEAKERFIVSRRIAIENAVANVDNQIKNNLIDDIIVDYAKRHDIHVILRNSQVIYSIAPDITKDILDILNGKDITIGLGLEKLNFNNVLKELNKQIEAQTASFSIK